MKYAVLVQRSEDLPSTRQIVAFSSRAGLDLAGIINEVNKIVSSKFVVIAWTNRVYDWVM